MTTAARDQLERRFALLDSDGDGHVERAEWDAEGQRIVRAFGETEKTPRGSAVITSYLRMWDYLAAQAGPGTQALSLDQFKQVARDHIANPADADFNDALQSTMRAIADMCDHDDEGRVTPQGFRSWIKAIGADTAKADETFRRIDVDDDGTLDLNELADAVRGYHAGTLDVSLLGA
jgi:Ca2+-binding EF-hand superfamily protein